MNTKHTPGPWVINDQQDGALTIQKAGSPEKIAMLKVKYKANRSGREFFVVFDLGSDYANNYAAVKYAWDHNAHICET